MSNLNLFLFHEERFVHTIQFGTNTQTGTIIIYSVKTVNSITWIGNKRSFRCIILLHYLPGVPTFGIIYRRGEVKVFEQSESSTDWYIVLHTINPVASQTTFKNLIIFGFYTI